MRLGKCVFVTVLCEVNLLNHPKQQQQNQQHSQCQAEHSSVEVRIDFYLTIQKLVTLQFKPFAHDGRYETGFYVKLWKSYLMYMF